MASALRLRAALKRGALVTAANWPLVAVQFVATSVYKLALAVPVVGGAFMVAVLVGEDAMGMLSEGLRATTGLVFESLAGAPLALAGFLVALGLVAAVGAVVTFVARAGMLAILVAGERHAGDLEHLLPKRDGFHRAMASSAEAFLDGVRRFGRRYVALGAGLVAAYAIVGVVYLVLVVGAYRLSDGTAWATAWPLILVLATSGGVVTITLIDLAYDLLQVIVAVDDCTVGIAWKRLGTFLVHDSRQVSGIFGVMLTLVILASAASLLATAGVGLVAWVPLVGLIVFPLQAAAWLIRGLVFEYVDLTAVTAYISQYRRFTDVDADVAPSSTAWMKHA